MTTFIIEDKQNGVLIPFRHVVQELSFLTVATWCFRQIRVHIGAPFGLSVQEFERLTRERPEGYCVADRDMRVFLDSDIQVIDGAIDAFAKDGSPLLTIECVDATRWEIRSALPELASEMKRRGFEKQAE